MESRADGLFVDGREVRETSAGAAETPVSIVPHPVVSVSTVVHREALTDIQTHPCGCAEQREDWRLNDHRHSWAQ